MNEEVYELAAVKKGLNDQERSDFDLQFSSSRKDPTTALLFSLFLGMAGVDRFFIGDTGKGVGKLLTLGGVGIWAMIDWFLIQKATRRKNALLARDIKSVLIGNRSQ